MQINQPTMKVTEQSTKNHSQGISQHPFPGEEAHKLSYRGTWDPDADLCLLQKPAPINACRISSTGKCFLCVKDSDTGMFCLRGAKYSKL